MSNKYPNLIRWADWLDNIYPGQEGNNDESESVQFLLHFCSDEDARIAMMCEPFFKSLDEIAEANNVTVEEIASTLEEMSMKGLIMCSSLSGVLKYRRWPWLPGILEFVVLDKEIDPELLKYASDFYEERIRLTDMTAMPFEKRAHGGLRTIPIMESVAAKSTIMPFEELKPFIDKATKFSVANCACRTATRALGMGCEHTHIDTCIQLDDYADYGIRTQRAREISKEEVYEILRKMEKAGHVHQVFNTQGHDTTCFICNCCGCGCASLRTADEHGLQLCRQGGSRKVRGLRRVRRILQRQRAHPRHEFLRGGVRNQEPSGLHGHQLDGGVLGYGLPQAEDGKQERQCSLQGRLPRAHIYPGLYPQGRRGQIRRGAQGHQEGQSLPRSLRANLSA